MTKLVRDHSAGAYAVSVPCYLDECRGPRRMVQLSDAVIDLDGPAFQAYYHEQCAPGGKVARCDKWDCARPECRGV